MLLVALSHARATLTASGRFLVVREERALGSCTIVTRFTMELAELYGPLARVVPSQAKCTNCGQRTLLIPSLHSSFAGIITLTLPRLQHQWATIHLI